MAQIKEMSELFGFENTSNIFLIYNSPAKPLDPRSSPHVVGWARAYLGTIIYEGHLLELLSGLPDVRGRVYDPVNKTLVLASRLYMLSPLELALCREIADGIYVFRVNDSVLDIINPLIFATAYDVLGFNISRNEWRIVTRTLNTSLWLVRMDYGYNLWIAIPAGSSGWFTIERFFEGFNVTGFQGFVVYIIGNATNLTVLFEVYYEDGKMHGRSAELSGDELWISLPLKQGKVLEKVRLAIYSKDPVTNSFVVCLKYMAILSSHSD